MNELYELTERHVGGECTQEEEARLHALLQDRAARAMFVRHVTLMAAVRGTCKATDQEIAELRNMKGPEPLERPVRWFPRFLALAAALAIVAGGVWWFLPAPSIGLRVADVEGEVNVQHSTSNSQQPNGERNGSRAVVGQELLRGDRVVVPDGGKAVLKYEGEETTLALHSGVATLGMAADAKRVKLESGLLVCAVAPQKSPFQLDTPHGVAEVVGTRFSLGVNAAQTTLAVQEGQVDLRQNGRRLEVSAGDTAAADAAGMGKLEPAEAWVRELLVRAETGPWDVVNLGTGLYSQDVWRMDARGGAAARKIWNVPVESNQVGILSFRDGKRWARGVVTGRMKILPDGQSPSELAGAETLADATWKTYCSRQPNAGAEWQKARRAGLCLSCGSAGLERNNIYSILKWGEDPGAWCRFVVYFDTETPDGLRSLMAAWSEVAGPQPASEWLPKVDSGIGNEKVEVGLIAKGVLMEMEGLKFVPLGADMPLPPKELMGRK